MKKVFLSFLMVLSALSLSAQGNRTDSIRAKIFETKVNEMVTRLKMTDAQKTAFVPIYKDYNKDMKAAMGKHQKQAKPTTSAEAATQIKAHLERQKKAIDVREKYIDKLAGVLDADQLNQFLKVENRIQFKIGLRKDRVLHKRRPEQGQLDKNKRW